MTASHDANEWNTSIDLILDLASEAVDTVIATAETTTDPAVGLALMVEYSDTPEVLMALAANPALSRGARARASELLADLDRGAR
jgi:hypothetical protein